MTPQGQGQVQLHNQWYVQQYVVSTSHDAFSWKVLVGIFVLVLDDSFNFVNVYCNVGNKKFMEILQFC